MSRRRFATATATFNHFIHGIDDQKYAVAMNDGGGEDETIPIVHSQYSPVAYEDLSRSVQSRSRQNIDIWLSRRNLDVVVKRKSLLIFINALCGIGLMIVILQLCWDGSTCSDSHNELPIHIVKSLLSFFSILLCYQILDRKQLQLMIKFREKRRKVNTLKAPEVQVSMLSLLSLRWNNFRYRLWLQLIVCIWHPVPFLNELTHGWFPDELGLLMFFRLHLVFRVIRDYSEIWLNRRAIKKSVMYSTASPNFDWWLSLKTACYRSPIEFCSIVCSVSVVVFGYCIYILERETSPELFNFFTSQFLSLQCVTTGWASDTYDVYDPVTWMGKMVAITATLSGLILTSFIIGIVSQKIMPTRFEENALNLVMVEKTRLREKEAAVRLIQYCWRNHMRELELENKLRKKNPRLYQEISAHDEKEFMEEFLNRCKSLRNTRRERYEQEENTQHGHVDEMLTMVLDKLEHINTDVLTQALKHDESLTRVALVMTEVLTRQLKLEAWTERQSTKDTESTATATPSDGTHGHTSGTDNNPGYDDLIASIPPVIPQGPPPTTLPEGEQTSEPIRIDTPSQEGVRPIETMTSSPAQHLSPLMTSVKFAPPHLTLSPSPSPSPSPTSSIIRDDETPQERQAREIREMMMARQERAARVQAEWTRRTNSRSSRSGRSRSARWHSSDERERERLAQERLERMERRVIAAQASSPEKMGIPGPLTSINISEAATTPAATRHLSRTNSAHREHPSMSRPKTYGSMSPVTTTPMNLSPFIMSDDERGRPLQRAATVSSSTADFQHPHTHPHTLHQHPRSSLTVPALPVVPPYNLAAVVSAATSTSTPTMATSATSATSSTSNISPSSVSTSTPTGAFPTLSASSVPRVGDRDAQGRLIGPAQAAALAANAAAIATNTTPSTSSQSDIPPSRRHASRRETRRR